jgi:ketosteroid isomerase-like protein
MDTREVVEKYYQYVNSQDRASLLALFDADVVLEEQMVGHVVGIEALTELIATLDVAFPEFREVPQHIVIDGDQACVFAHISTVTSAGAAIEVRAANYFRVTDGKITHFANVHDTAPFPMPPQQ